MVRVITILLIMNFIKNLLRLFLLLTVTSSLSYGVQNNFFIGDTITVEKVIEKYISACGGDALKEINTEIRSGTLLRHIAGRVPLTVISGVPDKWYYNQMFAWGDQVSCGFNGITAWVQTTKAIESMEPDQLLDMRLLFDVQAPLKIKEFYPQMKLKGIEKIDDKEVIIITAVSSDGMNTELIFDMKTGYLIRAGHIFFDDYREVGKIKRPFLILLGKENGEEHRQMKMQFTEIKINQVIDNTVFEVPTCVLSEVDPPLYKSRKFFKASIEELDKCIGVYQHPDKPDVKYRIFRENDHLFLDLVGRSFKIEIIPESEVDYYTKFIGWDFHFSKDEFGIFNELIINTAISTIKASRIN